MLTGFISLNKEFVYPFLIIYFYSLNFPKFGVAFIKWNLKEEHTPAVN